MANFKTFWAAVAIVMAAFVSFVSCTEDPLGDPSLSDSFGQTVEKKYVAQPTDKFVRMEYNKYAEYVDGNINYVVELKKLYETSTGEQKRVALDPESYLDKVSLLGDAEQFGKWDESEYETTLKGDVTVVSGQTFSHGNFRITPMMTTSDWEATNGNGQVIKHETYFNRGRVVYARYVEETGDTLKVDFSLPTAKMSQVTSHPEVKISYNGKECDAVRYTLDVTADVTSSDHKGSTTFEPLKAQDVTYLIKAEKVHSRDITYTVVDGGIKMHIVSKWDNVPYKNGDIVIKAAMTADNGGEKEVSSVEGFTTSGQTFTTTTSRDFNATAQNGSGDSFKPQFHLSVSVEGTYSDDEGTVTADYDAKVNGFSQNLGSTTTSGSTITRPYAATANGTLTAGTATLPLSATSNWTLKAKRPDNFETKDENFVYRSRFSVSANGREMVTDYQYVEFDRNTYNNGVLVNSESKTMNMPASIEVKTTSPVAITASQRNKQVTVVTNRPGTLKSKDTSLEGDYTLRVYDRDVVATYSDGATETAHVTYSKILDKDGKELPYTEWENMQATYLDMPVKNSASTTSSEVYDVKTHWTATGTERGTVQTRSAGDTQTKNLQGSYQQTYGDEYVSGKDRTVWTVTPNGNGYDIAGEQFETYTVSGEKSVDKTSGRVSFSVNGVNGTVKTVENVDKYQTSGNGWSGTGIATYRDNASNGVAADAFENEYQINANGSLTLTLKGSKGPGASRTFSPKLTLTEGGQSISNGTDKGTYTSYTYTNKVNGVYALEGKEVKSSATASRELRIQKVTPPNVPDLIPGTILGISWTLVPGNDRDTGSPSQYVDGSGTRQAIKCTVIRSTEGAVAIPFAKWNNSKVVPTINDIKDGNFVNGNYGSEYNSGYYSDNGKWVPAIGNDEKSGASIKSINYRRYEGDPYPRSIRQETLKQWKWRGGNSYSMFYDDGLSWNIQDGVLTVYQGSEVVLQCK